MTDQPLGGSLTQMMANADAAVDNWIDHARRSGASTPELLALMLLSSENDMNKHGTMCLIAATAVQRIVSLTSKED